MKLEIIFRWVFLCIGMLWLTSCSPKAIDYEQVSDQEKIVIRFSHVVGEDTPKGQAARMFAKLVDEKTRGRVEVQVFANGSLYKDPEELEALRKGYIQMIAPSLSKLTPIVKEWGAFDLPFLFPRIEDYHRAFDGMPGEWLKDQMRERGFVPLGFWDNGFKQFTNNQRAIQEPYDLSGITVRIMPSSVLDGQFELLQAIPVEMSFSDVYSALEQGQVNGQENTISNIYNKRFYRVQEHLSKSDHGYLGYLVMMDQTFWRELPSDVQRAIQEAMAEVTLWERKQAQLLNERQYEAIKQCDCIQIYELTDEDKKAWKAFFEPLYTEVSVLLDKEFISGLRQTSSFGR